MSIFCFVSIGACYSWFVDTKNGNGSITFGKVELEIGGVTGTNPFSISISSRKQPNDQLLSSNITVKKSSTAVVTACKCSILLMKIWRRFYHISIA